MTESNSSPSQTASPSASSSATTPTTTQQQSPSQAPADQSSTSSGQATPRTFKVKVNGSEQEVHESDLIKNYQLASASQKRFQEAAAKEKQIQEQAARMKSDPWSVMKELGIDPRKVSEEFLAAQLEEEMLSPEQKKLRDLESENNKFKKEHQTREEQQKQARLEQLTNQQMQSLEQEFISGLQKSGLPANSTTVRRVAEIMHQAASQDIDLSVEDAIHIASENLREDFQNHFSSLNTPEALIAALGPEKMKMIREYELSKVKNPTSSAPTQKKTETPSKTAPKYKNADDFFAEARRKLGVK